MISLRTQTATIESVSRAPAKALAGSLEPILGFLRAILLSLAGLAGVGVFWALVSTYVAPDLPGPATTFDVFWEMVTNPFYDNGPNDKGIGLQLFASLKRVMIGFSIGTLIAVPIGVLIGINPVL